MRVDGNMTDAPNYFPNSFSGPAAADPAHAGWHADKASGDVARYPTGDDDNFSQVRVRAVYPAVSSPAVSSPAVSPRVV